LAEAQVSADGSFVAYTSDATDLVFGQVPGAFGQVDVFLYDRQNDKSFLVSHEAASLVTAASNKSESPSLGSGPDGVRRVQEHGLNLVLPVDNPTRATSSSTITTPKRTLW
jgi:hypothetical protein